MTIVLSYRRLGTSYAGRVMAREGVGERELSSFEGAPFARALELFAHALAHAPGDAEAIFERTDRAGLLSYVLDAESRVRLRAGDPAFIRELSEPTEIHR
jgi:hypothetical protein